MPGSSDQDVLANEVKHIRSSQRETHSDIKSMREEVIQMTRALADSTNEAKARRIQCQMRMEQLEKTQLEHDIWINGTNDTDGAKTILRSLQEWRESSDSFKRLFITTVLFTLVPMTITALVWLYSFVQSKGIPE